MHMDGTVALAKRPSFSQWVGGTEVMHGLALILLGVIYGIRIFGWIADALRNPQGVADLVN